MVLLRRRKKGEEDGRKGKKKEERGGRKGGKKGRKICLSPAGVILDNEWPFYDFILLQLP